MPRFLRHRCVLAAVFAVLLSALALGSTFASAAPVEKPHPAASVGSGHGFVSPPTLSATLQAARRLRGPDVSAFDGTVNWRAVRAAGNDFAFAKASEGVTYFAPLRVNWSQIAAHHFDVRGTYHFARPQPGRSPIAEANHFTNAVHRAGGWRPGDVFAGDFEWSQRMSPGDNRAWIRNFLTEVWKTTGHKPIIYTGAWWWNPNVGCSDLGGFQVWTASYTSSPIVPCGFKTWAFWQYTDHGSNGSGVGDMSVFNGTRTQLLALGGVTTKLRPVLRGGARGHAVFELTRSLSYLGYLPYPNIGRPRSVFGGWVNTAVAHFKADYHLTPSPIVDQVVWSALDRAVKLRGQNGYHPRVRPPLPAPRAKGKLTLPERAQAARTAPLAWKAARPVAHCSYRATLRQGNGGRDVAVLHVRLAELHLWPKTSGAHISRYFGPGTTTAVKRFQGLRHTGRDGVVGPRTLRALGMSVCLPNAPQLRVTVGLNGTPTYRGLALVLQDAQGHGWSGTLTSSDRRPGVAERYGRSSQLALWLCYKAHPDRCNPANPPGRSTHEQRSDGIAYAGPPGRLLAWWQMGMDVTNSTQALAVIHRLGYCVRRPYNSGRELHHLNLCSDPTPTLRRHKLAR